MITLICGKTATGKSSVVKELKKMNITPIVTYTTRPPRAGEIDGVDYYFISEEEFYRKDKDEFFAETTSYNVADGSTWHYGTALSDIIDESLEDKVLIVNPSGLIKIKNINNILVKTVLLVASESVMIKRLISRGDDISEAMRRIVADNNDFKSIYTYVDYIISTDYLSPKQVAENILEVNL